MRALVFRWQPGAGEIGYMLVPGIREFQSKPGEPGGLESIIGGDGIKAQWQSNWHADKTSLPNNVTATQISIAPSPATFLLNPSLS